MVASADSSSDDLVSIGDLAEACGVSPDTIRVWERRYGRPIPVRLPSGHRRYTADHVRWLRRVTEALSRGHRPARAVRATEEELDALLSTEDAQETTPREVSRLLDKVARYDRAGLVRSLRRSFEKHGLRACVAEVVAPLIHEIGRGWADGRLQVRHEHFVTEVLSGELRGLRESLPRRSRGPLVVLAALEDEEHELGLHMAAVHCVLAGAEPLVLGPRTPVAEIIATANELGAAAVAISVSLASGGIETDRTLAALRQELPAEIRLIVGGEGARGVRRGPRSVEYAQDFDQFETQLKELDATR